MYTNQQEQLHTQMDVKEQINSNSLNEKLFEREQIGGTPYWVIGNETEGYFISFGKWQMTERLQTIDDTLEYYEEHKVNILLSTVLILIAEDKTKK